RDKSTRGTRGTRKRGSPEGRVFHLGQPGQNYVRDAWDAKARNGRRFVRDSRDKSTRGTCGTRKRGLPEGRVFRPGQL
ncbi:hypothetical protein KI387_035679, partial [Taxus chinensis]